MTHDLRFRSWSARVPMGASSVLGTADDDVPDGIDPALLTAWVGGSRSDLDAQGDAVVVSPAHGGGVWTWTLPALTGTAMVRWCYDGAPQTVGDLTPQAVGSPSPDLTLPLSVEGYAPLDLTVVVGLGGGGGGSSDHRDLSHRDAPDQHPTSAVTGLDAALAARATASRTVTGGGRLAGGGDLTADRTITLPDKAVDLDALADAVAARLLPSGGTDGQTVVRAGGVPTWGSSGGGMPGIVGWYPTGEYSLLQGTHALLVGNGGEVKPGAGTVLLWRIMPVADVEVGGCWWLTQTAGGGGAAARAGIYAAGTSGPTGAPLVSSSSLPVTGTGVTSEAGWTWTRLHAWTLYYGAVHTNDAAWGLRVMTPTGANTSAVGTPLEAPFTQPSTGSQRWTQSATYGSLPTIGTVSRPAGVNTVPAVSWLVRPA